MPWLLPSCEVEAKNVPWLLPSCEVEVINVPWTRSICEVEAKNVPWLLPHCARWPKMCLGPARSARWRPRIVPLPARHIGLRSNPVIREHATSPPAAISCSFPDPSRRSRSPAPKPPANESQPPPIAVRWRKAGPTIARGWSEAW